MFVGSYGFGELDFDLAFMLAFAVAGFNYCDAFGFGFSAKVKVAEAFCTDGIWFHMGEGVGEPVGGMMIVLLAQRPMGFERMMLSSWE